jgi:hypothetical protein
VQKFEKRRCSEDKIMLLIAEPEILAVLEIRKVNAIWSPALANQGAD